MLRIVLIRPGSTDYNQQGRIQGTLDIPLNEQGSSEVAQTVEEIRDQGISVVYAPPCQPAHQTGQAIAAALDLKLKKLDRMQNLDHGLWQGMLIDDVRHKQPKVYRQWQEQPEIICPPEGETVGQVEERARAVLLKLLKRHKEGVIGLVLPEPLASVVRSMLRHEPVGDLWKAIGEQGGWEILEVTPDDILTLNP